MEILNLYKLLNQINNLHEITSIKFFEKNIDSINLKKKQVNQVFNEDTNMFSGEFLLYLDTYHNSLNQALVYNSLEYDFSNWDLRSRIKQKDSIINKLVHYQTIKAEKGSSPIQKCLNDLYGFRVVVDNFKHDQSEFNELLEGMKVDKPFIKWYYRDKDGYKATHIYFKNGKNINFPWELQIWAKQDEKNNLEAHRKHKSKRAYINWPSEFVEETKLKRGR